jgi:hypothetical protein
VQNLINEISKRKVGNALETWVFVAILVLSGFVLLSCGLKEAEISYSFIVAGAITASFSLLAFVKKFRKLLAQI